ncbi:dystrotelin isoform X2 [Halichoeres trimaculatus]
MNLESLEALNEIRPSVYRASMKLLSLQKLCGLDNVSIEHVTAAFQSVASGNQELNRQEVTNVLNTMFHLGSQEVEGHVTLASSEETCRLMFHLYERSEGQVGSVCAASVQTALTALSNDTLINKYRELVKAAEDGSGSVNRSGLRCLLQDLGQVLAAVQEEGVFGGVEAAVKSCFNGVLTPAAGKAHVLSWLQSEPYLLLWLPTLYRLCVSQKVSHAVRCHTCKTIPITGLRYRCMKCVNVHVCQTCFLTNRHTKKHKTHHPVLEFCTQPTWKESWSSLVNNARRALLPRRSTRRGSDSPRALTWDTLNRDPPPSDASTQVVTSTANQSSSQSVDSSNDASEQLPSCSNTPKETQQEEASALLSEVRNLQRDKWLLEQQLQAWRLTIQSDHSILEDRCADMEGIMERLKEQNLYLQGMLTQALNKMETQQHANYTPQSANTPQSINTEEDEEEEIEEEMFFEEEAERWEDEQPTPSPTMHQETLPSHDIPCEEAEPEDNLSLTPQMEKLGIADVEEAEPQDVDTCLCGEEDCGSCSAEELLQETVESLRTAMHTDRFGEPHTGETQALLEAAVQVGGSIQHLVDGVRRNSDGH